MAEQYPPVAGGQRVNGTLLRNMLPLGARKTSDTPRTATTTAIPDPHLVVDVEANAVYRWTGWVKYDADIAGDLLIDFTTPSGAFGEWTGIGAGNPVTGSSATPTLRIDTVGVNGYFVRTESSDVNQSRTYGGLGTGQYLTVLMFGTLRVGATAGTFSLDWAQGTSSATATTVYTDSWLELRRTA